MSLVRKVSGFFLSALWVYGYALLVGVFDILKLIESSLDPR
jgi:hypothetical protein